MEGQLNKNTTDNLKKLRRYLVLSGVVIKQEEMGNLNEWIELVETSISESEKNQNDVKVTINDLKF